MAKIVDIATEETIFAGGYLSYNKIKTWWDCPRSYQYYYEEGWRSRKRSAAFPFGSGIHRAIQAVLQNLIPEIRDEPEFVIVEAQDAFIHHWEPYIGADIEYGHADKDWETVAEKGMAMMALFVRHLRYLIVARNMVIDPRQVEVRRESVMDLCGHKVGFVAVIDWYGEIDGFKFALDWKTSSSEWKVSSVKLNDQLSSYYLHVDSLGLPVDFVGIGVLTKHAVPRWQLLIAERDEEELDAYRKKALYVSKQIMDREFHQRYQQSCDWCDYHPLCLKDKDEIKETLTKGR